MAIDWGDLITAAVRQGWRAEPGTRHLRLLAPDGQGVVTIAGTPSDWRAIHNTVAQLRRHGFSWAAGRRHTTPPPVPLDAEPGHPVEDVIGALCLAEAVYTVLMEAPQSPTELAERFHCPRGQARMCLEAMEQEGLLSRVERVPRAKHGVRPEWRYTCAHLAPRHRAVPSLGA
jgi:hypothetical protein